MNSLFPEYRNVNSQRKYPFADDATLLDADGQELPVDFILDLMLYPLDITGPIYLSSIELVPYKLYFTDASTGVTCGVATVSPGEKQATVYTADGTNIEIGTIILGDGADSVLSGNATRLYDLTATELCPSAYVPMNQVGVRGFILPDGTVITGAVKFRGQRGVVVSSNAFSNTIRVDIVGEGSSTDCGDCGPITEICIERKPSSNFMISRLGNAGIAITSYLFTLTDICTPQREMVLPDDNGNLPLKAKNNEPCEPPPLPPDPPAPGPDIEECFQASELAYGNFIISAPRLGANANAVVVKENAGNTVAGGVSGVISGVTAGEQAVQAISSPVRSSDGLQIGFRGLSIYRRRG